MPKPRAALFVFLLAGCMGIALLWAVARGRQRIARQVNEQMLAVNPYLERDPQLGWRNRLNSEGVFPPFGTDRLLYRIDGEGNRRDDDQTDVQGPPLRRMVWILGDSSAFGLCVEGERSFSGLLRRALRRYGVAVKNLAVIGYNSWQVGTLFRSRLRRAPRKPDLIIVWVGFNDTTQFLHEWFWKTPFAGLLAYGRYVRNVAALLAVSRRAGIKVIEVTIPCLEPHRQLERINGWIRTHQGISPELAVVDVQRAFAEQANRGLYAAFDDFLPCRFHPSERGHALIAELLLPVVKELLSKR